MTLGNGYEMTTTFMQDFAIARKFGIPAVKDTYKRAFAEWKNDPVYVAEMAIALNYHCWDAYDHGELDMAEALSDLYYAVQDYAYSTFKDEDARTYFNITD